MGQNSFLDTNVIIDYCGGKLPWSAMLAMNQVVDDGFSISPVVKIEVLGYNGSASDMQKLETLLNFGSILYIDDAVIQRTIDLRKTYKIKLGDAIIAATGLVYNLNLYSHNTQDFRNIAGLIIIDPHSL